MGFREFFGLNAREEQFVSVNQEQPVVEARHHSPVTLPPSRTAISIGPKEAARIATVYRAINIISTMISQMEVKVMRGKQELKYTPLLVREPIEGESFSSFTQQVVWSLALWGNCYIRLIGSDPDKPTSVRVLDPEDVVCSEDEQTGVIKYWVKGKQVNNKTIRHLKFERMPGALLGHGPLTGAAGELKAAYLLDQFQRQWFDVAGTPKGIITSEQNLTPEQSQEFVDAWMDFVEKNHQTIILPKGMGYAPVTLKPAEAQYLDVVEANVRSIARVFGIPAANMLSAVDGTSMTYTNQIESNIQFIQNTLSRYIIEIEDFLSSLLPRGQKVNFDEESLLRMAPEKLWAMKKIQHETGYYSGAEQREEEGKPPLPPINFDVEGVGANSLAAPEEKVDPKGDVDNVKDLGVGPKPENVAGKRTRCINDGQPLDGNETMFCSRKCKDEWYAKNKNKGAVV